jgi:hypothetical protein
MKGKNFFIIFALVIAVAILFTINSYQTKTQQEALSSLSANTLLKTIPADILAYTNAGKNANQEEIIKYTYVSNQVVGPQQYKGLKEDMSLRTPTSQAFVKAVKPLNAKESQVTYVGKFYSGLTFNQKDGEWRTVEYATTTKSAFLLQTKPTILTQMKGLLGQPVFAATYYAGGGDGYVGYYETYSSFSTVRSKEVGSPIMVDYTGSGGLFPILTAASDYYDSSAEFDIYRSFLPIDTSAIPSGAIISAATLYVYQGLLSSFDNADQYSFFRVVQATQANSASLDIADYNKCGVLDNPTGAGADKTSIGSGYIGVQFYSSNLSWIAKTGQTSACGTVAGTTCLGLREGHDISGVAPSTCCSRNRSHFIFSSSEQTGTYQDPYLEVTYTLPAIKINGGTMNINGGTVKVQGN